MYEFLIIVLTYLALPLEYSEVNASLFTLILNHVDTINRYSKSVLTAVLEWTLFAPREN